MGGGGGGGRSQPLPLRGPCSRNFPQVAIFFIIFLNSQLKTRNGEHGMGKKTFQSEAYTINGFLRVCGEINK